MSRIGSERAATSSGSSSRSAKNTERGSTSTAGTRSHQARSGESSSRLPAAVQRTPCAERSRAPIEQGPCTRANRSGAWRTLAMPRLRHGERVGAEVLRRVRQRALARRAPRAARRTRPPSSSAASAGRRLLRRQRLEPRARRSAPHAGRAPPRLRPLRRPGRLHDRLRRTRRRGHARAADPLLRHGAHDRSSATAARSRSSSATPSWPSGARRSRTRTTPSAPCAPRSTSSPAIPALDAALQARAGVLTGEAAVTLGAEGQGMVAGDLVNTASRIQSAAEPGTVLVGEATRRASEAAIAYADAGDARAEGQEPSRVRSGAALRVVAGTTGRGRVRRRSSRRSSVAIASCAWSRSSSTPIADERRAHLVSVVARARDRQVAARVGVREVHRRAVRAGAGGTGAAASPTAKASPTGRSPRWCACARGIAEDEAPEQAAREALRRRRARSSSTRRSARSSSRGSSTCSG